MTSRVAPLSSPMVWTSSTSTSATVPTCGICRFVYVHAYAGGMSFEHINKGHDDVAMQSGIYLTPRTNNT